MASLRRRPWFRCASVVAFVEPFDDAGRVVENHGEKDGKRVFSIGRVGDAFSNYDIDQPSKY